VETDGEAELKFLHDGTELPRSRFFSGGRRIKMAIDKDRVEGSAKNLKGKIKEGFGKLTGDAKTEAEGKADQAEGKAQNAFGGIKDTLRGK